MHNDNEKFISSRPDPLPDTTEPAPDNSAYDFRPQFPPGYVERAENLVRGSHEAAADPLPGPLLEAFLPEPLVAAGLELRPVVASDWAILKRIDSPLLRELARAATAAKNPDLAGPTTTFDEEEIWELLFLWTNPPPVVRAALAKGRPQFREHVMVTLADKMDPTVMSHAQAIVDALFGNLLRALSTRVSHGAASENAQDFRLAPPQTASAGGSVTSGR